MLLKNIVAFSILLLTAILVGLVACETHQLYQLMEKMPPHMYQPFDELENRYE